MLRNINLQNLKRASAFIDIMDRHLDKVFLGNIPHLDLTLNPFHTCTCVQEAQDFLDYYRDVLAKDKMIVNKGIYKRSVSTQTARCCVKVRDRVDRAGRAGAGDTRRLPQGDLAGREGADFVPGVHQPFLQEHSQADRYVL